MYRHTIICKHVKHAINFCCGMQVSLAKPPSRAVGHHSHEEKIEQLQAELEVKNQMLSEVKKHLREAVEREEALQALSKDGQVRTLACETFGGVWIRALYTCSSSSQFRL